MDLSSAFFIGVKKRYSTKEGTQNLFSEQKIYIFVTPKAISPPLRLQCNFLDVFITAHNVTNQLGES